jgi:hypothetical protein
MPLERTDAEIFAAFERGLMNDIRKCLPGKVVKVNVTPGQPVTVDVQLGINNVQFTDLGDVVEEAAPSLAQVPLAYFRAGGFLVWVPVAAGDTVLVLFSDLSADTWRLGDGGPQTPGFVGKHTLDSGWAIPMIAPDLQLATDVPIAPGKVIIGKDGSQAQIRLSATDIELGATPTDFVAMASKVDSALSTLIAYITAHVHTSAAPGNPTSPPTVPPTPAAPTGSTLVRVE